MAMAPEQREAIKKALNEDADKLISEGDPSDPHLRRLRDEIDKCNRLFAEYEERARRGEDAKRTFADDIQNLQSTLDDAERTLKSRCLNHIPRSLDTLETLVIEHKEFETQLQPYEEIVQRVQETFRELPKKSASQQTRLEKCLEKWERIWILSADYVERMKHVEVALSDLDDAIKLVSELELKLAASDTMPSDLDALRQVYDDLQSIQATLQTHQRVIDQLTDDIPHVRPSVNKTRPDRTRHPDVDRLEEDAKKLVKRWNQLGVAVPERLSNCEAAADMLRKYQKNMEAQKSWVSQMELQVQEVNDLESSLNQNVAVAERRKSIEEVNGDGGRFLREAKIFDSGLRKFLSSLEEVHPSLDASVRTPYGPSPSNQVQVELDDLNAAYLDLVAASDDKLRCMLDVLHQTDPEASAEFAMLKKSPNRPRHHGYFCWISDILYRAPKVLRHRAIGQLDTFVNANRLVAERVRPVKLRTFRDQFNITDSPDAVFHDVTRFSSIFLAENSAARKPPGSGVAQFVITSKGLRGTFLCAKIFVSATGAKSFCLCYATLETCLNY
ncbi:unnamed protein product [Notodromas monacha]|uniref:Uncharacterized protein n=1 Tax=Notodromas monacha TaxID=399045 RepID=A0A7R9G982_9CRUS|nr:unnamed protein product [Notodromas monacha]CAG0912337.1 unnamed protein product [Notodromas monacha]